MIDGVDKKVEFMYEIWHIPVLLLTGGGTYFVYYLLLFTVVLP